MLRNVAPPEQTTDDAAGRRCVTRSREDGRRRYNRATW